MPKKTLACAKTNDPISVKMLYPVKRLLLIVLLACANNCWCQDASIIIDNGAFIRATGGYIVLPGNIQTDGTVRSSGNMNWTFNGSTKQRITCKTGTGCPEVFNVNSFSTILGNVYQKNSNGIAIDVNTRVDGTHNFIQGATELNEGMYWLNNASGPFSGNNAADRFFVTKGHGLLKQTAIGTSPTLFPIGTSATANNYTPATLTYAGTADNFALRVIDNVYYGYDKTNGDPIADMVNFRFVKKTWIVNKETAITSGFGTAGFNVLLQWNLVNEDPAFTITKHDDISVVRNHDTIWFPQYPLGPSSPPSGGGPFSKTNTVYYDNDFYPYYPISVSGINYILPVTGLKLSAKPEGKDVQLNWLTLTEQNTKYFEVEKSYDGRTFAAIGSVNAAGNSSTQKNYQYTDRGVSGSIIYYRIKEYDSDGHSIVSNVVVLRFDDAATSGGIKVYPNPVQDHYTIQFNNLPGEYNIQLFTNAGKLVLAKNIAIGMGLQSEFMQEKEHAAGLYFLRITNKTTREVRTIKLNILR